MLLRFRKRNRHLLLAMASLAMQAWNVQNDHGLLASGRHGAKSALLTDLEPYILRAAIRAANLAPFQRNVKLLVPIHDFSFTCRYPRTPKM